MFLCISVSQCIEGNVHYAASINVLEENLPKYIYSVSQKNYKKHGLAFFNILRRISKLRFGGLFSLHLFLIIIY